MSVEKQEAVRKTDKPLAVHEIEKPGQTAAIFFSPAVVSLVGYLDLLAN